LKQLGLRALGFGPWLLLLYAARANAAELYVAPAPTGDDSNAGTQAAPLASIAKAQSLAKAGDTVFLRGGTYAYSKGTSTCTSGTATITGVTLDKSGTSGSPINYFAYPGEKPIFDFDGIRDSCRIKGFLVSGSWIHLKGLEIKGVRQNNDLNHESWGVWIQGSNNTFEALDIHHIMGAGLFIQHGSNNLVLNCDSHHNFDEHTSNGAGESGDGFGCHVSAGETGNVLRGNRAWWDSDDGFDFINSKAACIVEYSWAWFNGYKPDTMDGIGNGNGFKGGGYGADATQFPPAAERAQHTVRFCLAFANKAAGFYANHHPNSEFFYNNTSYGNHPNFNMLGENDAGADITVGVYRNNIALGGVMFSNNTKSPDDANNSWNIAGVSVTEADFKSVATSGMDAPRQADGSLPVLPNFRLAANSDLIDKGVDLKLPFAGKAPDLGAFEVGLDNPVVVGGSGNLGGTAGANTGGAMTGTAGAGAGTGGTPNAAGTMGNDGGSGMTTSGGATSGPTSGGSSGSATTAGTPPVSTAGNGVGGNTIDPPEPADTAAGCGCRVASPGSSASSRWLLLGALAVFRRRRRG
jgi:MYXO-CTERM domain-containing protein